MARFWGKIMGKKGPGASRLGSSKSGLYCVAASWDGAVDVHLYVDDKNRDCACINLVPWGSGGRRNSTTVFAGPLNPDATHPAREAEPCPERPS